MAMHKKHRITFVTIFVAILAVSIFISHRSPKEEPQMCTIDAKLCSDGTYVGRVGPRCEFVECPRFVISTIDKNNWKTSSNSNLGVNFEYPEDISTNYIQTLDWPPKVQVISGPFACVDVGEPNAQTGQTLIRKINNHDYCVTTVTNHTTDSTYYQYAYERQIQNKILYFTFSLKFADCTKYDDLERNSCKKEEAEFNIDNLLDNIIQTTKLI